MPVSWRFLVHMVILGGLRTRHCASIWCPVNEIEIQGAQPREKRKERKKREYIKVSTMSYREVPNIAFLN